MESPNFSFVELKITEALLPTKSCGDIADLIDRSADEVGGLIEDLVKRKKVVTLEMKLEAQQNLKKNLIKKMQVLITKIKEPAAAKNPVVRRVKKIDSDKQRQADLKEQKRKNIAERLQVEAERKNLKRLPILPTLEVDYSKMITVMIDRRTCIYVKPGENIEAAKKLYLAKLEAQKSSMIAKNAKPKYNRQGTKICTRCEKEKTRDEFHNNRLSPDGKDTICKNCKETLRKIKLKENIITL